MITVSCSICTVPAFLVTVALVLGVKVDVTEERLFVPDAGVAVLVITPFVAVAAPAYPSKSFTRYVSVLCSSGFIVPIVQRIVPGSLCPGAAAYSTVPEIGASPPL